MNPPAAVRAEWPVLVALIVFTIASLLLGVVANLVTSKKAGFLQKYFLGNRSMGAVAAALTAAVMSGGTFLGFPSLVYTFGWVVGLWICSYMIAPMVLMGVMGKRIGQIARRTGAITLPDLFRERFGSPTLGVISSIVVVLFLSAFMVAQFVAGARIMKTVLPIGEAPAGIAAIARADDAPEPEAIVEPTATTAQPASSTPDYAYLLGLLIFTVTVVAYTTYGGFLAAIWTDVFQSVVMGVGVWILLPLALIALGGMEQATIQGVAQAGDGFAFPPGANREFLPITLAVSYFVMWTIVAAGQPSTIVRLMAMRDSRTLRYSLIYQTIYNGLIYIPLIFIFVAARGLAAKGILPNLASPDDVMPTLVITLANPYVAGIIMAAPYGAVLSTVSGWLLIISSGLVRDLYQRFLRPEASDRELARASYAGTIAVGLVVALIATKPPDYLQLIVVFASSGLASAFLVPAFLGCYWRRATAPGMIAAMVGGAGVTLLLYALGKFGVDAFGLGSILPPNPEIGPAKGLRPYYLLGFEPCIWGISSSMSLGLLVSLATRRPDPARVSLLFDAQPPDAPAPATLDLLGARPDPARP